MQLKDLNLLPEVHKLYESFEREFASVQRERDDGLRRSAYLSLLVLKMMTTVSLQNHGPYPKELLSKHLELAEVYLKDRYSEYKSFGDELDERARSLGF